MNRPSIRQTTRTTGQAAHVAHFAAGDARGVLRDGLCIYRGLPYAMPPTGPCRWRPPVPMPAWEGVREAVSPGAACTQPARRPGSIYDTPLAAQSEDCLFLDIWAPEGADKLPVLVWIHGGSLIWGAASEPMYDGAALARRDAVVVTINYRLGIFGYFAHPELSAESPSGVSGNYGLLDQIAALEWVRDNISAVGGDPANVTIAGESAGALSVLYLMAAPPARGLFARAIAQSAYLISTPSLKEDRHGHLSAEAAGQRLAGKLVAGGLDDLRAMDARSLADAASGASFAPSGTVDGHLLPDQLVDVFERGEQAPVPLIAGFNSGEMRSMPVLVPPSPANAQAYEDEIRARYGDLAERYLSLYPSDDMAESASASVRDALYGWTAVKLAQAQKAAGNAAFLYLFDHGYPAADEAGLHGFHACELPFLFGTAGRTPPLWPIAPATEADEAMSQAIGDFWISFARDGVPQARGHHNWPDWTSTGRHLRFADVPKVEGDLLPGMFALVDDVVRLRRDEGDVAWNWNVGVAAPHLKTRATRL